MSTITKKNLIEKIYTKSQYKQGDIKEIVQIFLDSVIQELSDGNKVELRRFGIFETKKCPAREARNPITGDKVEVPAKKVVKFKLGKMMKAGKNNIFCVCFHRKF